MKNWNEKTTVEKIATVISVISLCLWLLFEFLDSKGVVSYAETLSYIAVSVCCVCEAVSFWKTKRAFSYVAIAGAVCIVAAMIMLALL